MLAESRLRRRNPIEAELGPCIVIIASASYSSWYKIPEAKKGVGGFWSQLVGPGNHYHERGDCFTRHSEAELRSRAVDIRVETTVSAGYFYMLAGWARRFVACVFPGLGG
jgi:hypothetical protein